MTAAGQHRVPAPCPRCTGYGDAHYLTCPTLRLEPSAEEIATQQMREWYGPGWQPPEKTVVPAIVTIDGQSIAEGYGRVGTNEAVAVPP